MTPTECATDLADGLTAGHVAITAANETDAVAGWDMWRIADGHTYEELAAHMEEERRLAEAAQPGLGHPGFVGDLIRSNLLDPRQTRTIVGSLRPGTYGVVCVTFLDTVGEPRPFAVSGPIAVATPALPASIAPAPATPSPAEAPGAPPARGYHVLVGHEGGIVLFGGQTASPPAGGKELSDTWEYGSADGWVRTQETGTPWADAAAFDAGSGRAVVLLDGGGTSVYDPAADTWRKHTSTGGLRSTFGMRAAYDVESDRTVLLAEDRTTWAYDADGDTWSKSTAEGPPSRLWHVMAYDQESDRVVLFGGTTRSDADLGDTWAYDLNADAWEEMSPAVSPSARRYAAIAYDPGTDRMILFGGVSGRQEEPLSDTWAYDYDKNIWTQLSSATAPSPRAWHAMAYDPGSGSIVLFGGGRTRDEPTAETWLFDPEATTWTRAL